MKMKRIAVVLIAVALMVSAGNARAETNGVKGKARITDKERNLQAEVWYAKGLKYMGTKEFDAAKDALTEAIFLSPTFTKAYLNRAIVYEKMGQNDKVIEDYTKAISLDSKDPYPFDERGTMYLKMGQHDKAIEDYTKAISLDPDVTYLLNKYNNRAFAYLKMGQYDKAIEDYTKTLSLYENPDNYVVAHDAYNNRGLAYEYSGQLDKAVSDFRKACELGVEIGCKNARIIKRK